MSKAETEYTISINNLPQFSSYIGCLNSVQNQPSFVEILWDNFCHLDADQIRDVAAAARYKIALHVMWSRFLEVDSSEWRRRLRKLRSHVEVLRPVYVSDHLCRFSDGPARFAIPLEHSYDNLRDVVNRIDAYQHEIGQQLLIENYASTCSGGERQIDFVAELEVRTKCGLLFDVTNARVAALNGIETFERWLEFVAGRRLRCHVGGFAADDHDGTHHDTHDRPLDPCFESDFGRVLSAADVMSVCYERDQRLDVTEIVKDLQRIKGVIAAI